MTTRPPTTAPTTRSSTTTGGTASTVGAFGQSSSLSAVQRIPALTTTVVQRSTLPITASPGSRLVGTSAEAFAALSMRMSGVTDEEEAPLSIQERAAAAAVLRQKQQVAELRLLQQSTQDGINYREGAILSASDRRNRKSFGARVPETNREASLLDDIEAISRQDRGGGGGDGGDDGGDGSDGGSEHAEDDDEDEPLPMLESARQNTRPAAVFQFQPLPVKQYGGAGGTGGVMDFMFEIERQIQQLGLRTFEERERQASYYLEREVFEWYRDEKLRRVNAGVEEFIIDRWSRYRQAFIRHYGVRHDADDAVAEYSQLSRVPLEARNLRCAAHCLHLVSSICLRTTVKQSVLPEEKKERLGADQMRMNEKERRRRLRVVCTPQRVDSDDSSRYDDSEFLVPTTPSLLTFRLQGGMQALKEKRREKKRQT